MNEKEKFDTIERYNSRFKKYGYSNLTLGWGEKDRSDLRFEIFKQSFDLNNTSILDFGCGFGGFYGYLKKLNIKPSFCLGIDINQNLLDEAKKHHPEVNFECIDIFKKSFLMQYNNKIDYVVSSGVFNYKSNKQFDFIKSCFNIFDKIATKGIACNFISDKIDKKFQIDKKLQYTAPEKILSLAYKYSNNIILRNDYMPFEFTIIIKKDIIVDEKLTVYKNYLKYVNKR